MKHPGHWQHFILRNDNRGLTTEQMRQKYVKESQLFEQFISYQLQQQQIMTNTAAVGGGRLTTSPEPVITPVTLAFEISSESGTSVLLQIGTKADKSVDVTVEWDPVGLVSAGSISETIAPSNTWSPSIDLIEADVNVPFRIILSDSSAIQLLTWTASNNDIGPNEYQIWTAPTNFSALTGTNTIQFEFQGVSELNISNFEGSQFSWVNDVTINSANLTNANVADLAFTDCSALTTLTLTGLTYGDENGGYSFNFYGCALNKETIVALLEAADASGYENGYINVEGGTNFEFNGGDYDDIEPFILSLGTISPPTGKGWEIYIN